MRELTQEQTEYAVARLTSLKDGRRYTQTQLASMSGVSQPMIAKIFAPFDSPQHVSPSTETLSKLSRAMGLKLSDILSETEQLPRELLGYLATPLTGLSDAEDAEVRRVVTAIKAVASGPQFVSPRFEIYWPGDHTHPKLQPTVSAHQVYITDRSRASSHDFIVLLCVTPSFGVGQENEIATQAGVPAIRLAPPGLSRMMTGSFVMALDVAIAGSLGSGITFDQGALAASFAEVRRSHVRHKALYAGINGDAFGTRLRKLVNDNASGYAQFASDLGISLSYLHTLMEEPIVVSNPSLRLLKRLSRLLNERVSYLIGESDESDPEFIEGNATWRSWLRDTRGVDADVALTIRDEWRQDLRQRQRLSRLSNRDQTEMNQAEWDRRYRKAVAKGGRSNGGLFD